MFSFKVNEHFVLAIVLEFSFIELLEPQQLQLSQLEPQFAQLLLQLLVEVPCDLLQF